MRKSPRVTDAVLLIVDISGYTRFVQKRAVSLEHAEAIITELMEAIIDRAGSPLVINKLEGDAALLYVETQGARREAIQDVLRQVASFFAVFSSSLQRIRTARSHCNCDACANIGSLQLKAFVHVGEIVVKRVRQFEEIAGEAVIRVHRMTKNTLPLHEYVLMTDSVIAAAGDAAPPVSPQAETIDGEAVVLHWCEVRALGGTKPGRRAPMATSGVPRSPVFRHLPKPGLWQRLRLHLLGTR